MKPPIKLQETPKKPSRRGLDPRYLHDATVVIAEGQHIATTGVQYLVDGIVPDYGMLGMLVAFAKVGKTTLGQSLAASVAMGTPFLDRPTTRRKVLVIAAEDPPEYTAYLARSLTVTKGWLTFYRASMQLTIDGLDTLVATIDEGQYGLVLIASWQAVIRNLVKDENDNAGAVRIVESVKERARKTGIPWLIDAHSGKGEDQEDDADPTRAMRGASGAAGAADYALSLRYANGAFDTRRRLSGKGRFVNLAPLMLDYDVETGLYTSLGSTKDAAKETTWRLIVEMGALDQTPRPLVDIARRAGLIGEQERLGGNQRRHLAQVLNGRPDVAKSEDLYQGKKRTLYRLLEVM